MDDTQTASVIAAPGRPALSRTRLAVVAGALLIGLALLHIGVAVWYYATDRYTRTFDGATLSIQAGEGAVAGSGIRVAAPSFRRPAMLGTTAGLDTALLGGVRVDLSDPSGKARVALVWRSAEHGQSQPVPLQPSGGETAAVDLAGHPQWRGHVIGFALLLLTDPQSPVIVTRVTFTPRGDAGVGMFMARIRESWLDTGAWTQRSINFNEAGLQAVFLLPTVAALLWIAASVLALAGLSFGLKMPTVQPAGWIAIVLVAWLALDLRWQLDLGNRAFETWRDLSGKTWQERRASGEFGSLFTLVEQVKAQMPSTPQRLFIVGDLVERVAPWLSYFSLPHMAIVTDRSPGPMSLAAGDYVLVIPPLDSMVYRVETGELVWLRKGERPPRSGDRISLPHRRAEMIHAAPGGQWTLLKIAGD